MLPRYRVELIEGNVLFSLDHAHPRDSVTSHNNGTPDTAGHGDKRMWENPYTHSSPKTNFVSVL